MIAILLVSRHGLVTSRVSYSGLGFFPCFNIGKINYQLHAVYRHRPASWYFVILSRDILNFV